MTQLTDVPESGVYLQVGAITQLVVQIEDYSTGEPIQLQTASDLTLTLILPDGSVRIFEAELYTDGSDGRIAYTTVNEGYGQTDLIQKGLYGMQGQALISGEWIPPSALTDFYVLPNNPSSGIEPLAYTVDAVVFLDAYKKRWAVTSSTIGAVVIAAANSGPVNSIQFPALTLRDTAGQNWAITMSTAGAFASEKTDSEANFIPLLNVVDTAATVRKMVVSTTGVVSFA